MSKERGVDDLTGEPIGGIEEGRDSEESELVSGSGSEFEEAIEAEEIGEYSCKEGRTLTSATVVGIDVDTVSPTEATNWEELVEVELATLEVPPRFGSADTPSTAATNGVATA